MPEPDFYQIAARVVDEIRTAAAASAAWTRPEKPPHDTVAVEIAEALRLIWNARGAADCATAAALLDDHAPGSIVIDALRSWDR